MGYWPGKKIGRDANRLRLRPIAKSIFCTSRQPGRGQTDGF